MMIKIITVLMLAVFIQSCEAETATNVKSKDESSLQEQSIEKTITDFSVALADKNLGLLRTVVDPEEIVVVRLFTSGNLGGRGEPLSQKMPTSKINSELAFDIKNQTPFELPGLFANLPIESVRDLPRRQLSPEVDSLYFDQWQTILMRSLKGAPEAVNGDSVLLVSSKYHVYAEAQIIDDILVGGFAVFAMKDGKLRLVSLIELL